MIAFRVDCIVRPRLPKKRPNRPEPSLTMDNKMAICATCQLFDSANSKCMASGCGCPSEWYRVNPWSRMVVCPRRKW